MDTKPLHHKLILAARRNPPPEQVPYAFEKRVMALLAARPRLDGWAVWSRNLWRAAALCAFVSAAVGGWRYAQDSRDRSSEAISLAFEKTVFAPMDQSIGEMW